MPRELFENPEPLIQRVYSYAAYRLGAGPDAEDATSETFARALQYRASYDPSKGDTAAWLLGIARRCVDQALTERRPTGPMAREPEATGGVEEPTVARLTLRAALARLSEAERELIALRYGADLKATQIAQLLDERTNTVEVALHRALRRLRALLGEPRGHAGDVARESYEANPL